jgi:hypothetical protein
MKKKLAALLLCAAIVLTFLPAAAAASWLDVWEAEDSSTYVHPGETAVMIVDARTESPDDLTCVWYLYNNETGSYELVEGETGRTVEVENVRRTLYYRCDVSDSSGASGSVYFCISTNNELYARASDDNNGSVKVAPGEDAVLSVVVEGFDLEGVTYSWSDGNYNVIDGAASSSYTVENVTRPEYYHCYVEDAYGSYDYVDFHVSVDNAFSVEAAEEDVAVAPGTNAVLTVNASAADPVNITYTWFDKNYNEIEGAVSSSYTVENVTGYSNYSCRVDDGYGNDQTVYFYVSVDNAFSAEAETSSVSAEPGADAVLKVNVSATDMSNVTYTWYGSGGAIDGAASDSYTVENVSGYSNYRCYVDDGYGNGQTVYFYVSIDNEFSAEAETEDVFAEPGESAALKVNVTAKNMTGVSFKWYDDDYNIIDGVVGDSYTVENVGGRTSYHCNVQDGFGSSTTVWFYVGVDNGFSAKAAAQTVYAEPGADVSLKVNVTAKDTDGMTFKWYRNGSFIESAASDSYTLENIDGYSRLYCTVSDKYGNSDTVYFYVYVDNAFSAEAEKQTVAVEAGANATLKVNVSARDTDGMTFEWYKNGSLIEGAATDTLTVENVRTYGEYNCRVSDKYGSSGNVWFYVKVDNAFSARAAKRNIRVLPGEDAELRVKLTVRDDEGLSIRWYEDGSLIEGASGTSYTAENILGQKQYRCDVADRYGNRKSLWFNVSVRNAFSAKAEKQDVFVSPGGTAALKVIATAKDTDGMTFEWYDGNYRRIADVEGDTLTVENVTAKSNYRCDVEDKYGNSSTVYFYVSVDNGFSATAAKTNFTVSPGGSALLEAGVTATDRENLSIKWYDGQGRLLDTAAAATSINVEDIWEYSEYRCSVADKYGNSKTLWFNVSVDNGFSATAEKQSISVPAGGSAVLKVNASAADSEGMTFVWYDDYTLTEASVTDSLSLTNISENRDYRCTVTDKYGNEVNVWFYVKVDNAFSARAENQSVSVPNGGSAVLKVIASAKDPDSLTFTWYDDDYYVIEGAETAALTVSDITECGEYHCTVEDVYGNYKSVWFDVYVDNGFIATSTRSTVYVPVGGSAVLNANISAADPSGMIIEWYKDSTVIPGAETASYTAENVTGYSEYRCEIEDRFGNYASVWFNVGVDNGFTVSTPGGSNRYVAYGDPVTLTVLCTAVDTDGVTYEWAELTEQYEDGYTYYSSSPIPDAVSDTYVIQSVTGKRTINCTVTDKYGNNETVTFTTGVYNDLSVMRIGDSVQFAPYGTPLTLSVQVSAIDRDGLECVWTELSGDKYSSSSGGLVLSAGTSYTIPSVTQSTVYQFRAVDRYGNDASCIFTVGPDNGLTLNLAPGTEYENYVPYGGSKTVGFTATATDAEGLSYQWYGYSWNGDYYETVYYDESNSGTFTVSNVTRAVELECCVTDKFGNSIGESISVGVENGLTVASADGGNTVYSLAGGASATLTAAASATDPEGLAYSWSILIPIDEHNSKSRPLGVTSASCTVSEPGNYRCTVTDKFGNRKGVTFTVTAGGDVGGKDGLVQDSDGVFRYYRSGVLQSSFTGLVPTDYGIWYVSRGVLDKSVNGLTAVGGVLCEISEGQLVDWHTGLVQYGDKWVYVESGKQAMSYTGLLQTDYGWWYVAKGIVDPGFTGLFTNDYGTWYIYNGQYADWFTGLFADASGTRYIYNGQPADWFSGLISTDYGWWLVYEGRLADWYTGLFANDYGTWYIYNGQLADWYAGLVGTDYGWWYVYNGQLANWYTGLVQNDYGWWYVYNGQLADWFTGLVGTDYGWWYVYNGQVANWFTGLVQNDYGWWFVYEGQIANWYTGLYNNDYGWWYIYNGQAATWFTGLVQNDYGWWYIYEGQIANWYTGVFTNDYGTWFIYEGSLGDWYTGSYEQNGVTYQFVGGHCD